MRSSRRIVALAACALIGAAAVPLLGKEGASPTPDEDGRYLLHLATDRPSYRPGETVRVRGLLLHALTRRPHAGRAMARVEVRSPRGDLVAEGFVTGGSGALGFAWPVPADAAGGRYALKVLPREGHPPAETWFEVRRYRVPRLKSELEFVRKAYGPGEEVRARLEVVRAEGGAPAGARATVIARVDGRVVHRASERLDGEGALELAFRLPAEVETPDATLAVVIEDGGVQETAAKTIPIVLNRLRLTLFPEGGELVGGLENRVYFEARSLTDDPADVRGRVLDAAGQVVARLESVHEGRGRFAFVPRSGEAYAVVLDEPAGIAERFALPPVREEGYALSAVAERVAAGAPLRVRVAAALSAGEPIAGTLTVAAKERVIASAPVVLDRDPREVELALPSWAAGVLRVTLADAAGTPRAERLVFRDLPADLRLSVEAPARAAPGESVRVRVTARDAAGQPIDALVAVTAVDDATLERIDPRERAPRLPTQVLLGSDVRELKDAAAYLDEPRHGGAELDLLLGTQGWRRFVWREPDAFVAAHGDAARRALALRGEPIALAWPRFARGLAADGAGGAMPPAPLGAVAAPPEAEGAVEEEPAAVAPAPAPEPAEPQAIPEPRPAAEAKVAEEAAAAELAAPRMERARPAPLAGGPFRVERQYAYRARGPKGARAAFDETVAWTAGERTGADGVLELAFDLSDSITTFVVRAEGVSGSGALAWAEATIEARRPFYLEAKLPQEVTAGDRLLIPVAVVNGLDAAGVAHVVPTVAGAGLSFQAFPAALTLGAGERGRLLLPVVVGEAAGEVSLRLAGVLSGSGVPHTDDVTRTIRIVPRGFPIEHAFGGEVAAASPLRAQVTIPAGVSPGSLETEAFLYPTPLAQLTQALAALLREPYGCFEQTSSTNYPNVMAMQYLRSHTGVDPALVRQTEELLQRGLARLVSFECKERGYEWFGGDPGHEALTAYGLLEFTDMAEVMPVDRAMIERTRAWLLSRRDGEGGFLRNARALDSFGRAPQQVTDAYITWALVEAGETSCAKEVSAVLEGARASQDPYVLALAANVALRTGAREQAAGILARLARLQAEDGSLPGAKTSITSSQGDNLLIETTALAALGFMRRQDRAREADAAMRFLFERCQGGRFGSTQATVLALRAIVLYDALRARPALPGTAELWVDGQPAGEVAFEAGAEGPIALPSFAAALTPGEHAIELRLVGGASLPGSLVVRYRADTPASSPAAKVRLETALVAEGLTEGEVGELRVRLRNVTPEGLPMTIAIVGVPGGCRVLTDRLEELERGGAFDFVETRGREVILYWRGLAPEASREVILPFVAEIGGTSTAPASRTYLYYADDHEHWVAGETLEVAIRGR